MKHSVTEKLADWLIIYPTDNTFVRNGKYADSNFSNEEHMLCMDKEGEDNFAKMLIKFDISEALNKDFSKAYLTFYTHQGDNIAYFDMYETDSFDEETVTFNTAPKAKDFVKRFSANACCDCTDLTEYIKEKSKQGEKEINLCIVCDKENPIFKDFSSTRKPVKSKRMCLRLLCGEKTFEENLPTDENFGKENPFDYAKKLVEEYLEHYKAWGSHTGGVGVKPIIDDKEEYTLNVPAKKGPNSESLLYPSRTVESIKGYAPTVDEVDNFGGFLGEQYEATGFFYTKEINGRWMLIDPKGHPYFNSGICTTCPGDCREDREKIANDFGSLENWAASVCKRFKELRIGSTGGSSAINYINTYEDPINMMMTLGFASSYGRKHNMAMSGAGCWIFVNNNCLPVFDPDFELHCNEQAEKHTEDWRDNPYFIGYMTDNEVSVESKTLLNYLMLDTSKAENSYAYAFAWKWLSAVTGKQYPDFSDITKELLEKFRGAVYDRYFNVASSAIRKYDKNHLYMGCRFKSPGYFSEDIMRAEGYYCDICTHNLYFCWEPDSELLANWANWNKKPFIVTEFYTKAENSGFKNAAGAGWVCPTQVERGQFFENYVLKLLESTNCVGFHWFRYMDCAKGGFLGANASDFDSNKGVFTGDLVEYTPLTDKMYKVCKQAYSLINFFNKRRK